MGSLPSSPIPIIENPPAPAPPPSPQDNDPIDMNHIPEESRYSLRKRNVAQLNPYTVENMRYQRALRSNPDAIVKMKALERLNHHHSGNHYEPDGETQGDVYLDEGAPDDEDSAWVRRRGGGWNYALKRNADDRKEPCGRHLQSRTKPDIRKFFEI